mmetsp:Transcript_8624/g.28408  ORF Transcript_8624/g.28408 Transcript_8624/m.28408 type:complete len:261 (+) Transcript_8624:958-1740(+)|eukprot:scaffold3326_cov116-Isochrysis_galbana.AAC.9
MRRLHDGVVGGCRVFECLFDRRTFQDTAKEKATRHVARANRCTVEGQEGCRDVPRLVFSHASHFKGYPRVAPSSGEMLHQDEMCPAVRAHEAAASLNHLGRSGRSPGAIIGAAGQDAKLQHIWAQHIGSKRRLPHEELRNTGRHNASLLRMAHHRVACEEGLRIGRLDFSIGLENVAALLGGAEISAQNSITPAQHATRLDARHQCGNLVAGRGITFPCAVLGVVRELASMQWPHLNTQPAHWKHGRRISCGTVHDMRLD